MDSYLSQDEKLTVKYTIWTRVADPISQDESHYTEHDFIR